MSAPQTPDQAVDLGWTSKGMLVYTPDWSLSELSTALDGLGGPYPDVNSGGLDAGEILSLPSTPLPGFPGGDGDELHLTPSKVFGLSPADVAELNLSDSDDDDLLADGRSRVNRNLAKQHSFIDNAPPFPPSSQFAPKHVRSPSPQQQDDDYDDYDELADDLNVVEGDSPSPPLPRLGSTTGGGHRSESSTSARLAAARRTLFPARRAVQNEFDLDDLESDPLVPTVVASPFGSKAHEDAAATSFAAPASASSTRPATPRESSSGTGRLGGEDEDDFGWGSPVMSSLLSPWSTAASPPPSVIRSPEQPVTDSEAALRRAVAAAALSPSPGPKSPSISDVDHATLLADATAAAAARSSAKLAAAVKATREEAASSTAARIQALKSSAALEAQQAKSAIAAFKKAEAERKAKEAAAKAKAEAEARAKAEAQAKAQAAAKAQADAAAKAKADAADAADAAGQQQQGASGQTPGGVAAASPGGDGIAAKAAAAASAAAAGGKAKSLSVQMRDMRRAVLESVRKTAEPITVQLENKDSGMGAKLRPLKKAIHLATGQIAMSVTSVSDKKKRIAEALSVAKDAGGEQLYCYGLMLTAEKLVGQAETQIARARTTHPEFAYGMVVALLSAEHPLFADVMIGVLNEVCVYTVPLVVTPERFKDKGGVAAWAAYVGKKDGEADSAYGERMEGLMRMFAAILQTAGADVIAQRVPFGMGHAWAWLARAASVNPVPMLVQLVGVFLEVAGYEMSKRYGKQFSKLMMFLCGPWLAKIPKGTAPGPVSRIRMMGQEFAENGHQFPVPDGKNLPRE